MSATRKIVFLLATLVVLCFMFFSFTLIALDEPPSVFFKRIHFSSSMFGKGSVSTDSYLLKQVSGDKGKNIVLGPLTEDLVVTQPKLTQPVTPLLRNTVKKVDFKHASKNVALKVLDRNINPFSSQVSFVLDFAPTDPSAIITKNSHKMNLKIGLPFTPVAKNPFFNYEDPKMFQHGPILVPKSKPLQGEIPIVVVTATRDGMLRQTLQSLLTVPGIERTSVLVSIDVKDQSNFPKMEAVVNDFEGVQLTKNDGNPSMVDGASRIAFHYGYTLNVAFESFDSDYIIIVEDDMVFSKDFLSYFKQVKPFYDESVYCVSTWNDNGFKHLVADSAKLLRTDFFIGLGWMASKKIYLNEWKYIWPSTHWDHFLREPDRRKGRQCIYPEISRNYNIGVVGTHSDSILFNKYFRDIILNQNANTKMDVSAIKLNDYVSELAALVKRSISLPRPFDGKGIVSCLESLKNQVVTIYYDASGPSDSVWEFAIAPLFNLWHSVPFIRTSDHGVVRFWFKSNYVLLIPSYSEYFGKWSDVSLEMRWKVSDFSVGKGVSSENVQEHIDSLKSAKVVVVLGRQGISCDDACAELSSKGAVFKCDIQYLSHLNSCFVMKSLTTCSKCESNNGGDQPAMVQGQTCLVNQGKFTCNQKHHLTRRFCPCV